jgi:hypothetical protein
MEYVKAKDFELDHDKTYDAPAFSTSSLQHIESKTDLDIESNDPFFEYTFKIQQNLTLRYRFMSQCVDQEGVNQALTGLQLEGTRHSLMLQVRQHRNKPALRRI